MKERISIPEDWAEKQCNAFTEWLNYMFQPTEDMDHELTVKQIENGHAGSHQSMHRAALRTLVVHQRLAQARTRGLQVFHTPEMDKARKVIVAEISRERLALRADRDIHADLTLRGKVVSLLLSYSTQWLRIGLEVLFGEPICAEAATKPSLQKSLINENKAAKNRRPVMSRMKLTLKNFIVNRLLADPTTLRKYTKGRCNIPSGRFEKQYHEEMRTLVLTRLLVLIVFLDKAKMASVLDRVPRLFTKESKVKSTRDVLVSFCRDFLSSEGDIIKHLSRIGLKVVYTQEPIDELEFSVANLAADIRDGVRLARMTEILSNAQPKSFLATLRLPAVSRLQKLHNVGVVLDVLGDRGVPNLSKVAAHHIVDGHREQVLQLLWNVVSHSGLGAVLDPNAVHEEIRKVEFSNRTRSVTWELQGKMATEALEITIFEEGGAEEQRIRALLLRWCNAVTSPFGVQVSNYTTSFADGVAICLLIHYYHPSLLRLNEIEPTSRHGVDIDEALVNERLNLELAGKRMSELGGIPKLLPMGDSRNLPEEKSMILCLVYLCSRLMESSTEVLACIAIQGWYRRTMRIELMKRKMEASRVIWKTWEDCKDAYYVARKLKYSWSVRVIERFAMVNKDQLYALRIKRELHEERARCITVMQAHVRRRQAQQKVQPLLRRDFSARVIQKNWQVSRLHRALDSLHQQRTSATAIQTAWRGFSAYASFSAVLWGIASLQALVRGVAVRKSLLQKSIAATQIQRIWRGFMCQVHLQVDILDIVTVQSIARRYLALRLRSQKAKAIVQVQQFFRKVLSVRMLEQKRTERMVEKSRQEAAVMLQSALRGYVARQVLHRSRCRIRACEEIQRIFRGWITRHKLKKTVAACVLVQSAVRGFMLRSKMKVIESSALLVQTSWRRFSQQARFLCAVRSVVTIQAFARQLIIKSELQVVDSSAMMIQATWRCFKERMRYEQAIMSATTIQSFVRAKLAARCFTRKACAVVVVQRYLRKWKACRVAVLARMKRQALEQAEKERNAAIRIQSIARRMNSVACVNGVRAEIQRQAAIMLWAAVVIQACVRFFLATSLTQSLRRDRRARLETESSVAMQSIARRYLSVQEAKRRRGVRHHAATIIQAQWRSLSATSTLRESVAAATVIQKVTRGALVRVDIDKLTSHARIIQATWRMYQLKMDYKCAIQHVVIAQTVIRRQIAKRSACSRRMSVLAIQGFGRIVLAKSNVNEMKMEQAATAIQKVIRGAIVRAEIDRLSSNARIIQATWRMYQLKTNYKCAIQQVVIAQTVIRRQIAKRSAHARRMAVLTVQAFGRIVLAKSNVSKMKAEQVAFIVETESARCIQAICRGYKTRNLLRRQTVAATIIQSEWKCFIAFLQYQSDLVDIVIVQSVVRGWQARKLAWRKTGALQMIQATARRWLASKHAKARFAEMVAQLLVRSGAAVKIQAAFRAYKGKILLQNHKAATVIQKTWRCFTGHVDFLLAILDVITIQRCARLYVKKSREAIATPGITAMQSLYRGLIQRRHSRRRLEAIIVLQSCCRGLLARHALKLDRKAATTIQRHVRGFLDRVDLEIQKYAASEIQRVWRGFLDRIESLYRLVMILRIQSATRRWFAIRAIKQKRREAEVEHRFRSCKARLLQRAFRRYLEVLKLENAACVVQKAARVYLTKQRFEKMDAGVVLIQAYWRSHRVRCVRTKITREVARRIASANERALQNPDMVLGVRTQRALQELQTSKRLTEIMEAAKILETSTRLSINCCVAFVEVGAPNILYDLIGTCNRSLPHIEILYYVLLTLQNVSKHDHLLKDVATSKCTEIFLDLVQMLRDKHDVFIVALTLLSRVVRSNEDCMKICSKVENMKRLNHVMKKVSVALQSRQDTSRTSRARTATMTRRDPVKILRSLLVFLK